MYIQRDSSLRCRSCLCCHIRDTAVEALKRQVKCAQRTDTGSHVVWYAVSVHDELLAGPFVQIIKYDSGWNTCTPQRFDSEVIWNVWLRQLWMTVDAWETGKSKREESGRQPLGVGSLGGSLWSCARPLVPIRKQTNFWATRLSGYSMGGWSRRRAAKTNGMLLTQIVHRHTEYSYRI